MTTGDIKVTDGEKRDEREGNKREKMEGKKELKHSPQKVYVGKQKKRRQNHSWENEHLPPPGQGCLSGAHLSPHCLTRAPTSARPLPGCILLPPCSLGPQEDHAVDPQAVRIWGSSFGVLSSTEQGNPYLQSHWNTSFLQTLAFKQPSGHLNTRHPTNHLSSDLNPAFQLVRL